MVAYPVLFMKILGATYGLDTLLFEPLKHLVMNALAYCFVHFDLNMGI